MQDLKLKQDIVRQGLDKLIRQNQWHILTGQTDIDFSKSLDKDTSRVIHNLNNTRYYKIKKCKNFIKSMIQKADILDNEVLFITFTFNEETLNNTTELARRKRIKRILQNNCLMYVANIDFGTKNEREHYHIVALTKDNYNLTKYEKNGFFKAVNVNYKEESNERLAKYLNKLTYHAFKDTTTQHDNTTYRCIYYNILKK